MTNESSQTDSPSEMPTSPSFLRHSRFIFIGLLIALLLIPAGIYILNLGSEAAEGIYIANGGQTCLKIERGLLGNLKVTDGFLVNMPDGESERTMKVRYRFGKLYIEQVEIVDYEGYEGQGRLVSQQDAILTPSTEISGDWNLIDANFDMVGHANKIKALADAFDWSFVFFEDAFDIIKEESRLEILLQKLPAANAPIPSFLRRIDDFDALPYFEARRLNNDDKLCLTLIRSLCAAHPDDPYLLLHLIEMEAREGDIETALKTWERWEAAHAASADPLLQLVSRNVYKNMLHFQWARTHDTPYYDEIFRSSEIMERDGFFSWDKYEEWLIERSEHKSLQLMDMPIVMTDKRHDIGWDYPVPNFLKVQTIIKCAVVKSNLALLEGDFDKSRQILTGAYLFSMDYNAHPDNLIKALIGIAARNITIEGLKTYTFNACNTEEDILQACRLLDNLNALPGQAIAFDELMYGERSPFQLQMEGISGWMIYNTFDAETRFECADARSAALRQAAWMRLYRKRFDAWPADLQTAADTIGAPIVNDPFKPSDTLRMHLTTNTLNIYSLGPDGDDDLSAIDYDPTNGTVSSGDIVMRIPEQPTYPFSPDGTRADNADDLLKQFPNGLPRDIFSYDPNLRLSVMDSTTTQPVTVFSIGPDQKLENYNLRNTPPAWSQYGEYYQPVFIREFKNTDNEKPELQETDQEASNPPSLPGAILSPQYDPSNRTQSEGDIYLELPRRKN